ncbi:MAG: hypothetical protein OHK0022_19280 [Roseiflexaceae bacterium]
MTKRSTLQPSGKAMLYNFMLNEVLASQTVSDYQLWLVAPWVINFALPRPFHVSFEEVVSTKQEALHLFDVLHQIAANGGRVQITIGDDHRYHAPLRALRERNTRIEVRVLTRLHAKAYAGRYGALEGSLNLTDSGFNQNAELYDYVCDEGSIARLSQLCTGYFERAEPLR